MSAYNHIKDERFRYDIITNKAGIFNALKVFFTNEEKKAAEPAAF